jgi:hypothetical protein
LWPFNLGNVIPLLFQAILRLLGIFNMLRGVFIFLVFIWKPSIWKATKNTHPKLAAVLAKISHLIVPGAARKRLWCRRGYTTTPENSPLQMQRNTSTTDGAANNRGAVYSAEVNEEADEDIDLMNVAARMERVARTSTTNASSFAFTQQQQHLLGGGGGKNDQGRIGLI